MDESLLPVTIFKSESSTSSSSIEIHKKLDELLKNKIENEILKKINSLELNNVDTGELLKKNKESVDSLFDAYDIDIKKYDVVQRLKGDIILDLISDVENGFNTQLYENLMKKNLADYNRIFTKKINSIFEEEMDIFYDLIKKEVDIL